MNAIKRHLIWILYSVDCGEFGRQKTMCAFRGRISHCDKNQRFLFWKLPTTKEVNKSDVRQHQPLQWKDENNAMTKTLNFEENELKEQLAAAAAAHAWKWKSFCQRLHFSWIQLDVVCHWVSTRRQKLRQTSIGCFFHLSIFKARKMHISLLRMNDE